VQNLNPTVFFSFAGKANMAGRFCDSRDEGEKSASTLLVS